MLQNESRTVNADDFTAGISFPDEAEGKSIMGIFISGNQNGPIENEEIGIGGRESVPILIMFGGRPGEGNEPVGGALKRFQLFQFVSHG